ncbi:LysE family translocator [Terasakiella sp. A23]|uniref:LysE family translocator n=1 Tax=Terasakiella sp. FCG-A23 TaxID=3080561 RepID=UPI0029544E11|nr:LysE family translocator [Terasakiella sp. A23]MDV7338962.1 LysE family translocator [Terasakiella sp. A23]
MSLDVVLMYAVVSFFYVISPGPAIFLAISNGMTQSMRAVCMSSLGNIIGLFILSAVSMFGLGALLMTSATLFMAVKVIGAIYLVYLGIKQFKNSRAAKLAGMEGHALPRRSYGNVFREGFFLAVTNPKPILFFTALFPQFLNLESALMPQFFVLTSIFMFFSFFSLSSYGLVSKMAKGWLSDQKRMMWFHRITGGIFIAMGVSLLQLKRAASN